jgi:uncharacterized membrane protein
MTRTSTHAAILAAASLAAAAAFAQAPAPAAPPVIPQQVSCVGEEPFWAFDANRTTGDLHRPGGKARQTVEFRGELLAIPFLAPKALVWRGNSTRLPAETLVATLREESCSSTMKEGPPREWRAILSTRPGEALTGCCTVRSGYDAAKAPLAAFAAKPEGDWSRGYPAYASAIARCVNESGVAVREVAKAWSADKSLVAVRLTASDGKAWNCAVDTTSKARPQATSVAVTDPPLAGAGNPVFYPARETPPIVSCGRLERIAGPRGRTDGWLHYDRC